MKLYAHRARIVLAVLALGSALLAPASLLGQQSTPPIFVALPDRFPDVDARVLLVREPGREIIVLNPASVGANELKVGLNLLAKFRRERGEPTDGNMIPVTGFAPGPYLSAEERARLETALSELRQRPVANVGNLGPGRWMRLNSR